MLSDPAPCPVANPGGNACTGAAAAVTETICAAGPFRPATPSASGPGQMTWACVTGPVWAVVDRPGPVPCARLSGPGR